MFSDKLKAYAKAGYPALWIDTFEETRATAQIKRSMEQLSAEKANGAACEVYEWDCLSGLTLRTNNGITEIKDTIDPVKLFLRIKEKCSNDRRRVFVLKDFHLQFNRPLKLPEYVASFKSIIQVLKSRSGMIIFLATNNRIPQEIHKDVQLLEFTLPDEAAIDARLSEIVAAVNKGIAGKKKLEISDEIRELAVEAAKGMTDAEVENAFALAAVENSTFDEGFVQSVFREKIIQIKKGGMLNYIEPDIGFENIGGFDIIKDWARTRRSGFTHRAREYKLPYPKGVGLTGIAGCGKTLFAKAIAKEFGFPLFQLDIGALFSKFVGETEQNFINLTRVINSIGRCVVLIDEIEKYLSTHAVSGAGDSGTSSRSFGTLLTWLNDRDTPAFLVYTSNDHTILPAPLVRKGRFDDVFWIDLPVLTEREEIYSVVIRKFGRDPKKFAVKKLAAQSNNFTGAEIENLFKDAMFRAFSENREVTTEDVTAEIKALNPIYKIYGDDIERMRDKADGVLRPASSRHLEDTLGDDLRQITSGIKDASDE